MYSISLRGAWNRERIHGLLSVMEVNYCFSNAESPRGTGGTGDPNDVGANSSNEERAIRKPAPDS
jgi:hypothetical protein